MSSKVDFELPVMVPPRTDGSWTLAQDWELDYCGIPFLVPSGFETDGASIPRFLWRICGTPLQTPRLYASIVHDYLYSLGGTDDDRKVADKLYRDLQIDLGISTIKAYTEYYALRMFGGSHWENKEEY